MRNILAILALFVCTSICLGQNVVNVNTNDGTGKYYNYAANSANANGWEPWTRSPINCTLNISGTARVLSAFGAHTQSGQGICGSMTGNKVNVNGGWFNDSIIAGAYSFGVSTVVNNNEVTITNKRGGDIRDVYGGRATAGTVSSNTVTIGGVKDVAIGGSVHGGYAGKGIVSSNTVTITSGTVKNVYGGYIEENGTATGNTVDLTSVTVNGNVCGAWIRNGYASSNTVTIISGTVHDVCGGYISQKGTATLNTVNLTDVKVSNDVLGARIRNGYASSNTVTITSGTVGRSVCGVWIVYTKTETTTATLNKVNLTSVTVSSNVYGARIGSYGYASSNTVTIISGTVGQDVYGGYILFNGTATINTVDMTRVTVNGNVYGAWIENGSGSGLASSNTVTIISGTVQNVYGGYITGNGTAIVNTVNLTGVTVRQSVLGTWIEKDGYASSNTVTINGGKTGGNVFGGYVGGNGKAIYNTITITGTEQSSPEFSTTTILCGGICADTATNNAFTGNTLNIETKGVVVNGISNFENYNFHLKDIKPGEVILTATSGGCSWDVVRKGYTTACEVDLSRSNISSLHTQGVLNKGEYCTLIKSPRGFKDNVVETKQCDFENEELLVKYSWEIKIADNKQDLIAKLTDKKIRDEGVAKSLSEGYGAGIVCANNGMDCVLSKIEETESLLGERKGEIGVFYGLAANKSSYNKELHIDMTGMSMMGGVGIRVEVGGKELSSKGTKFQGA